VEKDDGINMQAQDTFIAEIKKRWREMNVLIEAATTWNLEIWQEYGNIRTLGPADRITFSRVYTESEKRDAAKTKAS